MTEKLYKQLLILSASALKNRKSLFDAVNVSEPGDMVSEYYLSSKYKDNQTYQEILNSFKWFIKELYGKALKRKRIARQESFSDMYVLSYSSGNYRYDDLVDGELYRKGTMLHDAEPVLYDTSYKSGGKIDYDKMLEDMHKEMLSKDRLMHFYNRKTNKNYFAGNKYAIPIIALKERRQFNVKNKEELNALMG